MTEALYIIFFITIILFGAVKGHLNRIEAKVDLILTEHNLDFKSQKEIRSQKTTNRKILEGMYAAGNIEEAKIFEKKHNIS